MKKTSIHKKQGFYWFSLFIPLIIGACNQKNSESKNTTNMENTVDTSSQVRHMLLPEASPLSVLTQFVGVTELTVRYHRPALYNDSDELSHRIPFNEIWSPGNRHVTKFSPSDSILIK